MKKTYFYSFFFITIFSFTLTSNLLSQWTFVGAVTAAGTFPSIYVLDQNTVFVAGGPNAQPKVFRSTNGGVNFTQLGTTGVSLELYCIWATDVNTIYVGDGGASGGAGGNAKVYKTTDGGTTWTTILQTGGTAGFINGIVFSSKTSPTFGICQSDPPTGTGQSYWIAVTTNGGTNWTVTNPPGISGAASAQNSIVVMDNQFYGFGLNAGAARIYFTTNGGTGWNIGTLNVAGAFVGGFAVSSDKQTFIAGSSTSLPSISRSTNGGTSFSSVSVSGVTGYCNLKWVPGTNVCYLTSNGGAAGCAAKSTNGGATWTQMSTASITGITHMDLVYTSGTVYAYAVATDGSVIKLVDVLVGVNNGNTNIPSDYALEQNYPNPFNPSTTINYSLPEASNVTLKIYDVLGNEVMVVVNEHKTAGRHSATVDASNLASGVYFYRLEAGSYTDTKKMTLLK